MLRINNYCRKNQFIRLHLDFIGFTASLLCALHCVALPFLLSLTPLAGLQFLDNIYVEYAMIIISFLIASYALVRGYRKHYQKPLALLLVLFGFILIGAGQVLQAEWKEIILTSFGAITVAIAHLINWKQLKQCRVEFSNGIHLQKSKKLYVQN